METFRLLSYAEMESGLEEIRCSPRDAGRVEMIVRRPETGERETIDHGLIDTDEGLVGDNWLARGNPRRDDGTAEPDAQLTLMNSRAIALLAQQAERWPLAGDQFYVDLDLSIDNLPPGTRVAIGESVVEITALPHTGCKQFAARFGKDAVKFVNSPEGKQLRLRGVNARVVSGGAVKQGDLCRKQ